MVKAALKSYWLVLALMITIGQIAAAEAVIRGVVMDDNGKPVGGAIITATTGIKTVARYSQKDGKYEITAASGTYDVTVDAFGFAFARQSVDTAKSGKSDFKLTRKLDVSRFTSAEVESLLPDTAETRLIRRTCQACHSLGTVMKLRGLTAKGWEAFLPNMTKGRLPQPNFGAERLVVLSNTLEKYFGPDAPYLGPKSDPPKQEQVSHAMLTDAALRAKITEYKLPSDGALPDGVLVDARDRPWWAEFDSGNEVGEFDPLTQQFHIHAMTIPASAPKIGIVGRDGNLWFPLNGINLEEKLARINPDTGEVTYYKSNDPGWHGRAPHALALDSKGNLWNSGYYPAVFDIQKETYRVYQLPTATSFPEGAVGNWMEYPGLPKVGAQLSWHSTSSVAVDSKGMVYLTKLEEGTIVRLDPATGQTKDYRAPGMLSPRGVVVDGDDNVWFADPFSHALGRLDPRTGIVKEYHPPTAYALPFGATLDKRTGYIYFGDDAGNQITRFDPKAETFVEYPLPTPESFPRFIDVDSKGKIWYGSFAGKIGVIDPGPAQ